MKNVLLLSAFCLLLVACAPKIDPSLTSGVQGQVFIGPVCPVVQINNPCPDQPYQAKLTVINLDGKIVAKSSSDADGNFEIKLPPGDYLLHAESPEGGMLPYAEDVEFTVYPDEFSEVIVNFDSGIR